MSVGLGGSSCWSCFSTDTSRVARIPRGTLLSLRCTNFGSRPVSQTKVRFGVTDQEARDGDGGGLAVVFAGVREQAQVFEFQGAAVEGVEADGRDGGLG